MALGTILFDYVCLPLCLRLWLLRITSSDIFSAQQLKIVLGTAMFRYVFPSVSICPLLFRPRVTWHDFFLTCISYYTVSRSDAVAKWGAVVRSRINLQVMSLNMERFYAFFFLVLAQANSVPVQRAHDGGFELQRCCRVKFRIECYACMGTSWYRRI